MRFVLAAVAALLIAACGTSAPASVTPSAAPATQAATSAPAATSSPPSPSASPAETTQTATSLPSAAVVDLSGLDVCSLLSESDVQAVTGSSVEFHASGSDGQCFWGATVPGEPAYVELSVFARPTGLTGYSFNPGDGCAVTPVSGVGAEALGAVCENPQHKVYLLVADQGVAVQVLVNEPTTALDPEGLGELVTAAFDEIAGSQ